MIQVSKLKIPLAALSLACLFFSRAATAQITISSSGVVNSAGYTPAGLPGSGIAQGSMFSITGSGVGQDPPTQAAFPLATSLAGVNIQVTVGGQSVDALMAYVSGNLVSALLPSSTPVGSGTVTLTNNGATATSPITVVASSFGIFTATPGGFGPALAFVTNGDGSTTLISPAQPAQAGQTVTIAGTGLGAIAGDETQSGVTGTPSATPILWIGSQQVPVVSAGRGSCCTGLDPTYPVPAGIAAMDLISFVVPDGISGCAVSVAVQIENNVSNVPSIAIANGSGLCIDLSNITFDPANLSGTIKTGLESFTRVLSKDYEATGTSSVLSDLGAASFQAVTLTADITQLPATLAPLVSTVAGNCTVNVFRTDTANPPVVTPPANPGTPPAILDAGAAINVTGPVGTKPMNKGKEGAYSASFASVINIPLPGGLPPITNGGPPFLEPGAYTMDNGAGGADIGAFSVNVTAPPAVNWDNIDQLSTVTRSQGVTVKWSGGDPATVVGIGGSVNLVQGTISTGGSFQCIARTGDGQFAVPPYVTLKMPQSQVAQSPSNVSLMVVTQIQYQYLPIPGVDSNVLSWNSGTGRNVGFQ